jgi:hypothetical protein
MEKTIVENHALLFTPSLTVFQQTDSIELIFSIFMLNPSKDRLNIPLLLKETLL